jgi:hypothetical protein
MANAMMESRRKPRARTVSPRKLTREILQKSALKRRTKSLMANAVIESRRKPRVRNVSLRKLTRGILQKSALKGPKV